jgi:hypothetical protein
MPPKVKGEGKKKKKDPKNEKKSLKEVKEKVQKKKKKKEQPPEEIQPSGKKQNPDGGTASAAPVAEKGSAFESAGSSVLSALTYIPSSIGRGIASISATMAYSVSSGTSVVCEKAVTAVDVMYFAIAFQDNVIDRVLLNNAQRSMENILAHELFAPTGRLLGQLFFVLEAFRVNRAFSVAFSRRLCEYISIIGLPDNSIIQHNDMFTYNGSPLQVQDVQELEGTLSRTVRYFRKFTGEDAISTLLVGTDPHRMFHSFDTLIYENISRLIEMVLSPVGSLVLSKAPTFIVVCDIMESVLSLTSDPDSMEDLVLKYNISADNKGWGIFLSSSTFQVLQYVYYYLFIFY